MTTALVVLAPKAERFVGPHRALHDPSARIGVPAHVTLIVPFLADPIPLGGLGELRAFFADCPPFDYELGRLGRFPKTLFLAPEPEEPFRDLTRALVDRFGIKPYGGMFWPDIAPHLTIGDGLEPPAVDALEAELGASLEAVRPIRDSALEVTLFAKRGGWWHEVTRFPLDGAVS
jgi:2'-5' RNA ligase